MVKRMQFKIIVSKYKLGFLVERERPKKPRKRKVRTEQELVRRRKELLELRDQIKRDIKASENPAELRRELEMLEQTLIEYRFIFKEIQ